MKLIEFSLSMSLAVSLGLCTSPSQLSSQSPPPQPPPAMIYQQFDLPDAVVHWLQIPNHEQYSIRPVVADGLMTIAEFVQQGQPAPIAAINGGYFDPANQQTTSYIRIGETILADPTQNSRLIDNPDLKNYLPKILNRSEFRQYQCGPQVKYTITSYQHPVDQGCQLSYALGAGPQLLPQLTGQAEGFTDTVNGQVIRDAIGSRQPNARSAVGITQTGDVVWVMVEQQSTTKPGLSLPDLAAFLKGKGVEMALNLDGGSSSSLAYRGKVIAGKSLNGQPLFRPVKSVLLVQENTAN